jgi:ribosomal protein S18 acetylase RimI-like enzyme
VKPVHTLTDADLPGALVLSESAGWNQCEADWRLMLGLGRAWGLSAADGRLIASTLVLPYRTAGTTRFAWISMVLVAPGHRRQGHASTLLRVAVDELRASAMLPILDATAAGREVYSKEGFRGTWGFTRYRREGGAGDAIRSTGTPASALRPLQASDWPAILELDARAFGGDREPLLRSFASRLPQAAWVAESGGRLAAFVLGRDGREACQLGPLVATDPGAADQLLSVAAVKLEGPVYLDLADAQAVLQPRVAALGFVAQRSFTRMVLGPHRSPGDDALVVLVAGPEFG